MHFALFSVRRLAVGCLLVAAAVGCHKKSEDPNPSSGLSSAIQAIVPPAVLDDMRAKGVVINEGTEPPQLEGIYFDSPNVLVSPYGPEDGADKGDVYADYKYRFYDQKGTEVRIDSKSAGGTDVNTGVGALVSGSGNKFTIFAQEKGVSKGIENTSLTVYSGEITADGIANFQHAFTLTDKQGDANDDVLVPVGKARVFADGDGLANKVGSFRVGVFDGSAPAKSTERSAKAR